MKALISREKKTSGFGHTMIQKWITRRIIGYLAFIKVITRLPECSGH